MLIRLVVYFEPSRPTEGCGVALLLFASCCCRTFSLISIQKDCQSSCACIKDMSK